MKKSSVTTRAWWSVVGAATAASGVVAGWMPVAHAAPAAPDTDSGHRALHLRSAEAIDGTYESCSAYFGFGKWTDSVLDVVEFPVSDQNGSDGVSHAVDADTHVVLELTNADGDVLECTPFAVTETQWDDAMDDLNIYLPPGQSLPAWPGPGHYAYPTVSLQPYIPDFGEVTGVGFKVTGIPDGHTLVSPTDVKALVQHFPIGFDGYSDIVDPRVIDYVTAHAGAGPGAAFEAALGECGSQNLSGVSADLVAAVNALYDLRALDHVTAQGVDCGTVLSLNSDSSYLLGVEATAAYAEPIDLALPETTTTTSTTTTTPTTTAPSPTTTVAPRAPAATPVAATPRYTG